MVSDDIKTAVVQVDGGHQVNKTRKIQDRDKTGIRQRQVNGGWGGGVKGGVVRRGIKKTCTCPPWLMT